MDDDERLAPFPEENMCSMRVFEVYFGLRVSMTSSQHKRLLALIEEIVKAPHNQLKNGVHWLAGGGSRPNWSAVDAALVGAPAGPNAVPNGEEPSFDDDVYQLVSAARGFVSERERLKVEKERAIFDYCTDCKEPRYMTPSGPACKNGHGG